MRYLSQLEGEIQIQPPLRWSEIKDSKFRPDANLDRSVRYRTELAMTYKRPPPHTRTGSTPVS